MSNMTYRTSGRRPQLHAHGGTPAESRRDPRRRNLLAERAWLRSRGAAGDVRRAVLLLQAASQRVQQHGAEFHYVARSLWPLSPAGRAETDVEERGLRFVLENRDANFYAEEFLGGRRYFIAVYPDRATVPSCAECHNTHPGSSKRDFKQGDVIGGIIVRVPLEF